MNHDLDIEINRQGSNSVKWEFVKDGMTIRYTDAADKKYGKERLLPLWVADMDFRCPQAVIDALAKRVKHGIFGYTVPYASYYQTIIDWTERHYNWKIEQDWIVVSPGVVPAISMLIKALTEPGDKVLIQRPVYYPFTNATVGNGREVVSNTLLYENGRYLMDFDDLAKKAADPAVKLTIFSNPHNPVGRVWTREELTRFGEICLENNVTVISDEIHCDLILKGHTFTNFATISDAFAQNSIICTAPSKTFNLAGLKVSNIIIPNPDLRQKFANEINNTGLYGTNCFGAIGVEAAYKHGEPWLADVMAYVEDNYQFLKDYLAEHLPQVTVVPLEGTYLVWCDFNTLGLSIEARKELIMETAKVYLDEGELFGPEGEGFERFNLACPRSILAEALERIVTAVNNQS